MSEKTVTLAEEKSSYQISLSNIGIMAYERKEPLISGLKQGLGVMDDRG